MKTIRELDVNSDEYKILMIAISQLSCFGKYTTKQPLEILVDIWKIAEEVYSK